MSKCSCNMRRFFCIAIILLAGCSPKPTETNKGETQNTPPTIVGEWNWIRATGGIAGQTIVPKPGESQTYRFTEDSMAFFVQRFGDTSDSWNSKFSLRTQQSFVRPSVAPFLIFNDTLRIRSLVQSVWFHGSDTLELLDEAADGFSYLYVRP